MQVPEPAKPVKKFNKKLLLLPAVALGILIVVVVALLLTKDKIPVLNNVFGQNEQESTYVNLPKGTSEGKHCADYTVNGETQNECATCGDNVCEQWEVCQKQVTGRSYTADDCGPLFCPSDCKGLVPRS